MKILKGIGIFIIALIAIYAILGLFGPSNYHVSRSIKIKAPVDVVFNQTSIFANWGAWSPWADNDPGAKYTIENDKQEVGATMGWDGEVSGIGLMEVTEVVRNEKFIYKLSFIEPWEMTSTGGFIYSKEGKEVNLVWSDKGDIPFMQRPMMMFMDLEEMMGPMFEDGLKNIKEICENTKNETSMEITEETVESKTILFINENSSIMPAEISAKVGAAYGEMRALMGIAKIELASPPMTITKSYSIEDMTCEMDIALPVSDLPEGLELSGRIEKRETYAGKVLKTVHVGSYFKLKATYEGMLAHIKNNGYEINGSSWEEYVDDPQTVSEKERRTFIYFPVK